MVPFIAIIITLILETTTLYSSQFAPLTSDMLPCKTTLKAALHGVYYDEGGHLISASPIKDGALILDSNLIFSYDSTLNKLASSTEMRAYNFIVKQRKTAMKRGEEFRPWITNRTAKELTVEQGPRVQIPNGTRIVPITTSRTSYPYKSVLEKLESVNLGEKKASSYKDREIIADLFFADKRSEAAIPTFATADNGIVRPLCRLNPACAKLLGNKYLIRENYPQGFDVTITDGTGRRRTIRILPI